MQMALAQVLRQILLAVEIGKVRDLIIEVNRNGIDRFQEGLDAAMASFEELLDVMF
jgi:hypothetical protein